jgi:hypothetical protein
VPVALGTEVAPKLQRGSERTSLSFAFTNETAIFVLSRLGTQKSLEKFFFSDADMNTTVRHRTLDPKMIRKLSNKRYLFFDPISSILIGKTMVS